MRGMPRTHRDRHTRERRGHVPPCSHTRIRSHLARAQAGTAGPTYRGRRTHAPRHSRAQGPTHRVRAAWDARERGAPPDRRAAHTGAAADAPPFVGTLGPADHVAKHPKHAPAPCRGRVQVMHAYRARHSPNRPSWAQSVPASRDSAHAPAGAGVVRGSSDSRSRHTSALGAPARSHPAWLGSIGRRRTAAWAGGT